MLFRSSTNLPKTTAVGLDADGRAETLAMMDKHFDPSYQKVRTITGDLCFERGEYSRESGYWIATVVTGVTLQTVAWAMIGPNDKTTSRIMNCAYGGGYCKNATRNYSDVESSISTSSKNLLDILSNGVSRRRKDMDDSEFREAVEWALENPGEWQASPSDARIPHGQVMDREDALDSGIEL